MNLWAKTFGRLTVLAVALFFFSCEDETSILGYKNPNEKFNVTYYEIPLESSVMLIDSLRTSNSYSQTTGELNRLLVGKYADDRFGEVTAAAYTQFFTSSGSGSKTLLKESAVFDSIALNLRFDLYTYGAAGTTVQNFSVYELTKELKLDSSDFYFNRSNTSIDPSSLGSKMFTVDATAFQKYITDRKDTTITIRIPLASAFGQRIFASAIKYRNSTTAADSTFVRYREFVKEFKGIAIIPDNSDKIVGFTPFAPSLITIHYHDAETDSMRMNFNLGPWVNYNKIQANVSTSDLAGLTNYYQDFFPASDMRYVQAGTGIATKIDFTKLYDFIDADSNANTIVNSAQLIITGTEPTTLYPGMTSMLLVATKDNNRLKQLADTANRAQYDADVAAITGYRGYMTTAGGGYFTPVGEDGSIFTLEKTDESTSYSGFFTLFVQELFRKNTVKPRYKYYTLSSSNPQPGKAVERLVFNKNNLKLRINYTRPAKTPD
jgi:hypothetical protein